MFRSIFAPLGNQCRLLRNRNSLSFSLSKAAPSLSALIWECLQHRVRVTQGSTGGKGKDLRLNIDSRPWLTLKDTLHSAGRSFHTDTHNASAYMNTHTSPRRHDRIRNLHSGMSTDVDLSLCSLDQQMIKSQ